MVGPDSGYLPNFLQSFIELKLSKQPILEEPSLHVDNMSHGPRTQAWNLGWTNLKLSKAPCFVTRYSPNNVESPFVTRCRVTKPVLTPKYDHDLKTREKGIIWHSTSLGSPPDTAAVARYRYKRQFRSAFHEALKNHGYDEDGRKLVLDSQGIVIGKRKPGLSCTIQIVLNPPIKTVSREDLLIQADHLVRELERVQGRPWLVEAAKKKRKR
ncbi:hypothetical protein FQN49_002782 [Arthroderma sp. PD_2]|nr:hypothetical protein FQN49_002782 [Arthroderma sp. PD_2]